MSDETQGGGRPPSADEALATLEEGVARYRDGDAVQAHALFERAHRRAPADARAMSWYGLTLVLVQRNSNLGIVLCDQALRVAGADPELLLNQARAHLALGQRERAVRSIARGLAAFPDDPALKAAQESMGWRRRPVIPCLSRSNAINRWLGRLRHKWSQHIHPIAPTTPARLGLLPQDAAPRDSSAE